MTTEGGKDVNKKLNRLIEDEEITMAKIEELQKHLKDVRAARKQEEDQEIVRCIRARKLGSRALLELLASIQDGHIVIEPLPDPDPYGTATEVGQRESKVKEPNRNGAEDAPESEENHE